MLRNKEKTVAEEMKLKKLKWYSPLVFLPVPSEVSPGLRGIGGHWFGLETRIKQKLFKRSSSIYLMPTVE